MPDQLNDMDMDLLRGGRAVAGDDCTLCCQGDGASYQSQKSLS